MFSPFRSTPENDHDADAQAGDRFMPDSADATADASFDASADGASMDGMADGGGDAESFGPPPPHLDMPDGADPSSASERPDAMIAGPADVEDALGDVERHLQMLREIQNRHADREQRIDERERAVAERGRELDERARELEDHARSLEERRDALHSERSAFDEATAELTAERERTRREHDEEAARLESLRDGIAGERAQLEEAQAAVAAERAALEREQAELAEARQFQEADAERTAALEARGHELGAREAALAERTQELEAREADLSRREEDVAATEARLAEAQAAFETRQAEENAAIEQRSLELDARSADVAEEERILAQARDELEARRAQLDARDQELTDRAEALEADRAALDAARQALEHDESELRAERDRLAARVEELQDGARRSDEVGAELAEARAEAEAARTRLADTETAIAAAQQEGAQLAGELQASLERTQNTLAEREAALADAEERARRATEREHETAARLTEQLAAAESELAERRNQVEDHERELSALQERMQAEAEAAAAGGGATGDLDTEAMAAARATLEQRVAELEGEVARLERDLEQARSEADVAETAAAAAEAEAQDIRIRAGSSADGDHQQGLDDESVAQLDRLKGELQVRARRIAEIAAHHKRRRERLARMKLLLELEKQEDRGIKLKPGQRIVDLEQNAAQVRHIEQMRQEVVQRRRELAKSEKRMIRRWAAPKAFLSVASLVVIAVSSLAAGWLAAGKVAPPLRSASVTVRAFTDAPRHRTPEALAEWNQWHRARVADEAFLAEASARMAGVRLDDWTNATVLGERLQEDLTVQAGGEGELTLTLAGHDPSEIQSMLDVLAVSLATESVRTFKGKPGKAWAQVMGERTTDGIVRYAGLNDVAIRDRRLQVAGPVAGGTFAVLVFMVFGAYLVLQRARREIDEDGTLFTDSTDLGMVETLRPAA